MPVSIEISGVAELAKRLRGAGERLSQPPRPLLESIADVWATDFQGNFERQGSPEGDWEPLKPRTQRIRARRGFDPQKPILVRTGDLLQSIGLLEQGEFDIKVGTNLRYAQILQEGGVETYERDEPGERLIPARPFVVLHDDLVEKTFSMIEDFYFGDGSPSVPGGEAPRA